MREGNGGDFHDDDAARDRQLTGPRLVPFSGGLVGQLGAAHQLAGATTPDVHMEIFARREAFQLAIEWARSAGPQHCTRVPIAEMVAAAEKIRTFLRDKG